MATLGRWTGGAQAQGNLPEAWTAPNGLFPTQARNDGSAYTFTSATSTLTLPSSGLANGYLLIGRYEYADTSNGRFNPQGRIIQASGTGNFVGSPTGGYNRSNANDQSFVSCWAFVDNPSASSTYQFEWKADADDATGGTAASSFDVIPFFYADVGIYASTNAGLLGGTTPNVVPLSSTVLEGTNITRTANVITVTGDNKRYVVLSSQFYEGRGGRTQRWLGHDYDGTQDRASQAYAFYRNANNDENGSHVIDIIETVTASRTIEMTCYRGDGVGVNQGGADVDGSTPAAGDHSLVVLELNDSAEVFRTKDGTGGQNIDVGEATQTDLNISRVGDIDFNDSASWTRSTDSAMNTEQAMDALLGGNMSAAYRTLQNARYTGRLHVTINGAEDAQVFHGNYGRGNQGNVDTYGYGCNVAGFVALALNDDVGISIQEDGDAGDITTQAGWVGFWGINLDTLEDAGDVNVNLTGVQSASGIGTQTVVGDANPGVTGVSSATAVGLLSVSVDKNASLIGVVSSSGVGSLAAVGDASTTLTGTQSATSVGVVAVVAQAIVTATGVEAVAAVGSLTVALSANVNLTGVSAASGVGALSVTTAGNVNALVIGVAANTGVGTLATIGEASTTVGGVQATASVGSLTVSIAELVAISGVSSTSGVGMLSTTTDIQASVGGVQSVASPGALSVAGDAAIALTGVQSLASIGNLTVQAGGNVSVGIAGTQSNAQVGIISADFDFSAQLGGVQATSGIGVLAAQAQATANLIGVQAVSGIGALTVDVQGDATGAISGVSAAAQVGALSVQGEASVLISGISVQGQVGTVIAEAGDVNASIGGVSATGALGTLSLIGLANVALTGTQTASGVGQLVAVETTVSGFEVTKQVLEAIWELDYANHPGYDMWKKYFRREI